MLSLDRALTLAALAVYPLALLFVKRSSRLLMERTLRVQEGLGELSSRVQENLSGIHVVKAYACEDHEMRGVRASSTTASRRRTCASRACAASSGR